MTSPPYSPLNETQRIFDILCASVSTLNLPPTFPSIKRNIQFSSHHNRIYFPIPFKETETASALKGIEGGVASALWTLRGGEQNAKVTVNLEKATCFLFQAYVATVGGLGKQDVSVRGKLVGEYSTIGWWCWSWKVCVCRANHFLDTDFFQAQSNPYRRMAANLYETKEPGRYYHIHGSLEASTQLKAIGLEPFRPDLETHDEIVAVIEPAVKNFTVPELEDLNAKHKQAGVEALKHEDFLKTPHVSSVLSILSSPN